MFCGEGEKLVIRNEALECKARRSVAETEERRLKANTGSCTTVSSAAASN